MNKITRTEAVRLMHEETGSAFFAITFIKRTTGEIRRMVGRRGVHKGVKGVGLKFDPLQKGLLSIWDAQKRDFRFVNLETVLSLRINGQDFKIEA